MPVVFSTEGLQEKGGQVSLENREDVAPAPAPILQMVARSNTENKATPAPLNSRTGVAINSGHAGNSGNG